MRDVETIKKCRSCESADIHPFFDLGRHPLANSLLGKKNEKEKYFSLSLSFCKKCALVQLNETINPKLLFLDYPWVTGTSGVAKSFAPKFAKEVLRRVRTKKPYVFEIASNDGTFLVPFIAKGLRVLGVDPAENIMEFAEKLGVPTKCEFFGADVAKRLVSEGGQVDVIIARNVLYHLANLRSVLDGIRLLLAPKGIFVGEFHYGAKIQKELHYDAIYHEHVCYYTLKSYEGLLKQFGLRAFDIGWSPINSGGLIVYASKEKRPVSARLKSLQQKEKQVGANLFSRWKEFAERSLQHREQFMSALRALGGSNKRLVGYGASARSSTLLNYNAVTPKHIQAIADQNPMKHGRFMAGNRIPILPPVRVFSKKIDGVVLLAWNFADEIMEILARKHSFYGPFLVPFPERPRVIAETNQFKKK